MVATTHYWEAVEETKSMGDVDETYWKAVVVVTCSWVGRAEMGSLEVVATIRFSEAGVEINSLVMQVTT